MYDIVVIGGGASGLIAATEVAQNGKRTLLVEKNDRVGKKLLTTGNGRCNLANEDASMDHFHGSVKEIAEGVFRACSKEMLEDYWSSLGIDLVTLERGKQYPRSLQASSVLNALRRKLDRSGCEVLLSTEVTEIRPCQGGYLLTVKVASEKEVTKPIRKGRDAKGQKEQVQTQKVKVYTEKKIKTEKIVLCAGGKASPMLGSNGEGAALSRSLGMQITPMRPGICRILTDSPYGKRLAGVRMDQIPCTLLVDKKIVQTVKEEVLFTEEGLSGPAILDLSRNAGDALEESRFVQISMDLASEIEEGPLFGYLQERFTKLSDWTLEDALEGWMPKKVIVPVLNDAFLDRTQIAGEVNKRQLSALVQVMKHFTMDVRGLDGFKEAQVTVGGVRGDQIDENLQSKRNPGLYLCGEVLDLDGDCGGYNLMWAASSALYVSGILSWT